MSLYAHRDARRLHISATQPSPLNTITPISTHAFTPQGANASTNLLPPHEMHLHQPPSLPTTPQAHQHCRCTGRSGMRSPCETAPQRKIRHLQKVALIQPHIDEAQCGLTLGGPPPVTPLCAPGRMLSAGVYGAVPDPLCDARRGSVR